jgi:hypothetical protein
MSGLQTETSETISVRDHDRPCEHGSLWAHWTNTAKARWWQEPECLGGRAMILRKVDEGVWMEVREDDGTVEE